MGGWVSVWMDGWMNEWIQIYSYLYFSSFLIFGYGLRNLSPFQAKICFFLFLFIKVTPLHRLHPLPSIGLSYSTTLRAPCNRNFYDSPPPPWALCIQLSQDSRYVYVSMFYTARSFGQTGQGWTPNPGQQSPGQPTPDELLGSKCCLSENSEIEPVGSYVLNICAKDTERMLTGESHIAQIGVHTKKDPGLLLLPAHKIILTVKSFCHDAPSVCFLIQPMTTCLGMAPHTVDWVLAKSTNKQENTYRSI